MTFVRFKGLKNQSYIIPITIYNSEITDLTQIKYLIYLGTKFRNKKIKEGSLYE